MSGLEREITLDGKSMTLLQISASVNPGNSGGGVFDQYGNLIGLVVAKSSGSDAVSYTHLDVYKRQAVRSVPRCHEKVLLR